MIAGRGPALEPPAASLFEAEQMAPVGRNQILALPINCLLAVSIALMVRRQVGHAELSTWLAVVIAANAGRFVVAIRAPASATSRERCVAVLRAMTVLSLLSGTAWAFVPLAMLDVRSVQAPFVFCVLAGITAGAAVQGGCYARVTVAFVVPILLSLVGKFILLDGGNGFLLSSDTILYMFFLLRCSAGGEADFKKTTVLKLRATSLSASLERECATSRAAAACLHELANTDALTGLANRAAFLDRLAAWLQRVHGSPAEFFLLLLDLDHFKSVNDTLGHVTGDGLLKQVAGRLLLAVGEPSIVARLGGDEFAILLSTSSCDAVAAAAERVLGTLNDALQIGNHFVTVGASIGIAKFPQDGGTPHDLLARADLSLYAAKRDGRRRWRRFDAALLAIATRACDIERGLPDAITGSLQVCYRPRVTLLNPRRVTGLEATLRWNHPLHGSIEPSLIVAAALRIRKADVLTGFVLEQACRKLHALGDEGFQDVSVAINISAEEFSQYDVPELIRRMLGAYRIDPRRLEIELPEAAFAGVHQAPRALSELSAAGVQIALDQFGTGSSSIAHLRSIPVRRVKIDGAIVTGFVGRADDRLLVQAILGLAVSFGLEVTADGVESVDEADLLQRLGCHAMQGPEVGDAMGSPELAAWMAVRAPETTTTGCV